jgi:hypothetical protein
VHGELAARGDLHQLDETAGRFDHVAQANALERLAVVFRQRLQLRRLLDASLDGAVP